MLRWLSEPSDLSVYDQDDLDRISHQINTVAPSPTRAGGAYECYHRSAALMG